MVERASGGDQPSRIAILGGGLVGLTTALLMHQQGFKVAVIERQAPELMVGQLGMDIRNVALSPASVGVLRRAGVWGDMRATPYQRMCIWEQWGTETVNFDAVDVDATELGWLVELSRVVCAAWSQVVAAGGIEIVESGVAEIQAHMRAVDLHLEKGETRSFDFVIAADGARSVAHRSLNIPMIRQPINQVAIATVVRTQFSHEHTAWQRFLTEGPLAVLPGTDDRLSSIVWSQSTATAERRMQLDDDAFLQELTYASEHRLGQMLQVDRRYSFPLGQQRASQCAPHPRVVLVGDALRVIHPLAGQGMNLGLEDVCRLVAVSEHHQDLAVPGLWQKFARQRERRSQMMMQVMAALNQVYTQTRPSALLLRKVGIRSFNAMASLKKQVMAEAMGLAQS